MMTEPRFAAGDRVRISHRMTSAHHRVPAYAKGVAGEIERVCNAFGQPETLATGESGKPLQTLYRVRVQQTDIWDDYAGNPSDTLDIEIFEHWLEALENP